MSAQDKHERSQRLIELSEIKRKAHYEQFKGAERPVLWEHSKEGTPLSGFTDNYVRVVATEGVNAVDNNISTVVLGDFSEDGEALLGIPKH